MVTHVYLAALTQAFENLTSSSLHRATPMCTLAHLSYIAPSVSLNCAPYKHDHRAFASIMTPLKIAILPNDHLLLTQYA